MDGRLTALLLIVGLVPIAGCLGTGSLFGEACPAPELMVYHGDPTPIPTAGGASPVLFWSTHDGNGTALVNTHPVPPSHNEATMDPGADGQVGQAGSQAPVVDHMPPGLPSFGGFWLAPGLGPDDQRPAAVSLQSLVAAPVEPAAHEHPLACDEPSTTSQELSFQAVEAGEPVRPGVGVLVHTVGLWTNGTSFYTNDAAYHEGPYPKGYGDDWAGSDPLPVYVYDEDPDEIPRRYQEAGYFTTIQGFNEALKGMVVGLDALTYFPGELGYTREGNEDHALYGDDLIFYIEALEVREEPCPVPEPVCDIPKTPNPIPPPILAP